MAIYNRTVKQGSTEWHAIRCSIPTASEFSNIVTPKQLKLSSSSDGYMHQLIAQWIYGAPLEDYQSAAMARGRETEPQALAAYELEKGVDVEAVGIVLRDDGNVGASPDGLVGENGLVEAKCPNLKTHVGYLLNGDVADEYMVQLQGQLWVCEREWVDNISFAPRFPTVIVHVERREDYIAKLATAVDEFVDRMLEKRALLIQRYGDFRRKPAPPVEDPLGITDADVEHILAAQRSK